MTKKTVGGSKGATSGSRVNGTYNGMKKSPSLAATAKRTVRGATKRKA